MLAHIEDIVGYGEVFYSLNIKRVCRRVGHTNRKEFLSFTSLAWDECGSVLGPAVIRNLPEQYTLDYLRQLPRDSCARHPQYWYYRAIGAQQYGELFHWLEVTHGVPYPEEQRRRTHT